MAQHLLWSGYPYEVLIQNPKTKEFISKFLPEEAAIVIKTALKNRVGHIDIDGNLYFWSDVRHVERVQVPVWLDEIIFKKIQDSQKRLLIIKEIARLASISSCFHNEDNVRTFLFLHEESQKK